MANTSHVSEYPALVRHRAECRAAARARRGRLAVALPAIGVLIYAAAAISLELAVFAGAIGTAVVFFLSISGGSSVDPGALSGVEGERAVLKRLEALPDDFSVFNRVQVPDPRLVSGRRELDFIVAGPAGVFVVEVKNTPGLVYVSPEERHWPLARRAGCGSRPCWNSIDNPVIQASAQADALRRWLLEQGIAVQPRPVVCMAHPEVGIDNASASQVPVLTADSLTPFLLRQQPVQAPPTVLHALKDLRSPGLGSKRSATAQPA